ncbi:MAG: hypothetical protein U0168_11030 [Nannocystaceae bacterium]
MLVWRMVLGAVLAWELQMPFDPWQGTRTTLWLSATTGALVDERNLAFASRAGLPREPVRDARAHRGHAGRHRHRRARRAAFRATRARSFSCVTVPPVEVRPWHDDGRPGRSRNA